MTRATGALAAGAAIAIGAREVLRHRLPMDGWTAQNHAGRSVDLVNGPAFVVAVSVGALCHRAPLRQALRTVVAVGGSSAIGRYDDRCGDRAGQPAVKGLLGHVAELREGRVSTGAVKLFLLPVVGVAAARLGGVRPRRATLMLDGCLIAGSANLVNLLDRQPGRAIKASILAGGPVLALRVGRTAPGFAAGLGAVAALLPGDLRERAMLGDCGSNALGALLGVGATGLPYPIRAGIVGTIVVLTLSSERKSFSATIERSSVLRKIDGWGRVTAG